MIVGAALFSTLALGLLTGDWTTAVVWVLAQVFLLVVIAVAASARTPATGFRAWCEAHGRDPADVLSLIEYRQGVE